MADLFSVTAPLVIRLPDGSKHLMAERFRRPDEGESLAETSLSQGPRLHPEVEGRGARMHRLRIRHPRGLLFFAPFWHLGDPAAAP